MVFPGHLLLRERLFGLHLAPGQPALLEDWTGVERQRQILLLRRHHAESLFEADGKEAVGFDRDGREVRN